MKAETKASVVAQMDEAVNPDMVDDWREWTFRADKYPSVEGTPIEGRTFRVKPLNFKWDMVFRKYAMPMIGAGMQPIEMLVSTMLGGASDLSKLAGGLTRAIVVNELTVDELLPYAAGAIFASQDDSEEASKILGPQKSGRMDLCKLWADRAGELERETLLEVVEEQIKIQKAMHSLGKSLSTRFDSLGKLVDSKGNALNLSSILLGLMRPATSSSVPAGPTALTLSKSSGDSTEKPTTSGPPIIRRVSSGAKG